MISPRGAVFLAALSLGSNAQAQSDSSLAPSPDRVMEFVLGEAAKRGSPSPTIQMAFADLNRDQKPEALVYLSGPDWCGSGGCNLWILKAKGSSFEFRGRITIARLPVAALDRITGKWHHITVAVGGGGERYHRAAIPFLAGRYASNPTVSPAYLVDSAVRETVIMPLGTPMLDPPLRPPGATPRP